MSEQGFCNAGEFVGVVTRCEIFDLMDEIHFSAFRMTNEQRQTRKSDDKSVGSEHCL